MPKIAQYGEQQVATDVVRGPRAADLPLSAFPLAHYGKAVGDVAKNLDDMRIRIGQTRAEEEMVAFEKRKNDILFNPQTGYFNKQGKTAFDESSPANEALQKLMQEHADKLTDPDARAAFTKVAQNHVMSAQQSIMQHASKGLQAWEIATAKAQVENTLENATLYRNDPKQLSVQLELGRQSVIDAAQREGIDGDALNERLQTYTSAFTAATISASIADGAKNGKAAFEKYGKNLEEPDRIKLKDELEKKQKQEHAQYVSTIGVTAGRNIVNQYYGQGLDAAMKAVESKFKDPEARRAVENEVLAGFRRNDYMKQRTESDAADKAEAYLLDTRADSPRTVNGFKAEHPNLWEAMSEKTKRNLEAGAVTVTDQRTLNEIKSLPMDQLATLDMTQYVDKLSASDRKDVWKLIDDARAGKHDIQLQTDSQLIAAKAKQYGMDDEEKQAAFEAVNIELNKMAEAKGPLSDAERRKVIIDSLSEFKVRKGQTFWRGEREEVLTIENTPVPDLYAMNAVAGRLTANLTENEGAAVRSKIAEIRDELLEEDSPVNAGTILSRYQQKYGRNTSKVSQIPK